MTKNNEDMVAVTVAVGSAFEQIAKVAAESVTEMTGLPSIILGEEELMKSGVSHPAALRLKMFDFVDSENIMYFDADWLCLAKWTPQEYMNQNYLIACRDFYLLEEWPLQDYRFDSYDFNGSPSEIFTISPNQEIRVEYVNEVRSFMGNSSPVNMWINSGLFIANRTNHLEMLECALRLYTAKCGHHSKYYEQPAIQKAIHECDLSIKFLPRKYNVLAATERCWPSNVVGLHVKLKHHPALLKTLRSPNSTKVTTRTLREMFILSDREEQ